MHAIYKHLENMHKAEMSIVEILKLEDKHQNNSIEVSESDSWEVEENIKDSRIIKKCNQKNQSLAEDGNDELLEFGKKHFQNINYLYKFGT